MKEVYQDDCLGQSTIPHWHNFFTKGWELAASEPHGGQNASIVIEINIDTVAATVRDDHHMFLRTLESMVHLKTIYTPYSQQTFADASCLPHMCAALSHMRENEAMCAIGERMGT